MSSDAIPDTLPLKDAFDHDIYSSSGNPLKFGSLFYDCDVYPAEKRILVVFIRHFFCGNCQEYVRRLSSPDSPFRRSLKSTSTTWTTNFSKPATRTLPTVVIIGPGQPSLISSYKSLTECPFDIYADPSTKLYSILGMHKTLSMGGKSPGYIEQSLLSGAVKSAWQIVRRVGNGDAMAGGDWDVNGGEYLFTRTTTRSRAESRCQSRSRSRSRSANSQRSNRPDWEVSWCHRMVNSRDHTELVDLAYRTCFSVQSSLVENASRTKSPSPQPKSILVNGSKVHSRTISCSYSSECLGSCPGLEIAKYRAEIPAVTHTQSRSPSKSKSPHRRRSRSTSTSSRNTAKQKQNRIWSSMSSAGTSRSESHSSTTFAQESVVKSVSEVEEEETKPRKSFSASVADALGVRALLKRSKSVPEPSSNAGDTMPALRRSSTSPSATGPVSRAGSNSPEPKARSRTIARPVALLRTRSKPKQQPTENDRAQTLDTTLETPSHSQSRTRSKTSSNTRCPQKHRPSLSLTRKSSGQVEMDDKGVMCVDGVEFVNVISVKARVGSIGGEQRRKALRERSDSGLGMDVGEDTTGDVIAPVPVPVSIVAQGQAKMLAEGRAMMQYPALTALPEVGAVH